MAVGGFVSDRLVKKLGLRARLYVLAASQVRKGEKRRFICLFCCFILFSVCFYFFFFFF